jgi:mono/diheme cytochrome c family protein
MTTRSIVTVLALSLLIVAPSAIAGGGPDGAAIYKSKCAMCHGPDGAGQTTMGKNLKLRNLGSAVVQAQTDAQLNKWIADGKGKMPAYKAKLTPADIDALVGFIRTLKK